ncbi:MAG TPA: P-loop NTPase [Planctomycetota bacterium]|nr:P-loop NTPase [Planctomycetota bacterium]
MVRRLLAGLGKKPALGPRGRGIFDRLFGGVEAPENVAPREEATVIAIGSGKGGTGKSFLATSLAVLLHQQGRRVVLVDCDFGLACDHLLLGVTPQRTLQHILAGQASLADVVLTTPVGPRLVPGSSGVRQMADLSDHELAAFGRRLGEIAADADVMLLDCGAGIAPQTVLTMLCADHVVLVTQPEIAALTDAYAVIKCLRPLRHDVSLSVVVNRVPSRGQGDRAFEKLDEVTRRHTNLGVGYLGEIGDDPLVMQRRLGQPPLVVSDPNGTTAESVRLVLARLEQAAGTLVRRPVGNRGVEARFKEHRLFLE